MPTTEGEAVWTVFDPQGRIEGLVETPRLEVFEIGEDYVLGLVEDEMGVEYVGVGPGGGMTRPGRSVGVRRKQPFT